MEIIPSDYQQIELTRSEKIFIRNITSVPDYGHLLIKVNPTYIENNYMHVLINNEGVLLLKFFSEFSDANAFAKTIPMFIDTIYLNELNIAYSRLTSNKLLIDIKKKIKFNLNLLYIFPQLSFREVSETLPKDTRLEKFANENCMFSEDIARLRNSYSEVIGKFSKNSTFEIAEKKMNINDSNINSIIQRLAPEYVTLRVSTLKEENSGAGAQSELLIVDESDTVAKAYRLDKDQLNIVNKMPKGDQLILACAGSGKSVLLISKCFKAAAMNPKKKFLITCYNKKLNDLYNWYIDRAGLRAKNVECVTFHKLCMNLLDNARITYNSRDYDGIVDKFIQAMNEGKISDRYYGVFIDEVQMFTVEWYKACYNLLENKNNDDHLFVICGDKTQELKKQQKRGQAPWNAGEGYPSYRGGNKSVRIEKNYRNCIEINEYINRFVSNAKLFLNNIDKESKLDPDLFLRGQAFNSGIGVKLKKIKTATNQSEIDTIVSSINEIHDLNKIPYDEIAVIMNHGSYKKKLIGWDDSFYKIDSLLEEKLQKNDIPYEVMYNSSYRYHRYLQEKGVKLIKTQSSLGLDFRAAIVCGLKSMGDVKGSKYKVTFYNTNVETDIYKEVLEEAEENIKSLYVACTRAKEVLHIIAPETKEESNYIKILEESL